MKRIETDWESRHQNEQMLAVMGKDMELSEFWQSGEDRYNQMTFPLISHYRTDIENMVVLDIGCGPGRILRPFAKRAKKAIGVDVSETAVKTAKTNLAEYKTVEIIKNTGTSLSGIESKSIDLVTCYDVFQHIPTLKIQQSYLGEIARVLKSEGIFVIQIKTDSGWLKVLGIPIFPRRLRGLIPTWLMKLALFRKREQRMRDTWRGNLIHHNSITDVFATEGLRVNHVIPDGRGTRWVIAGQII